MAVELAAGYVSATVKFEGATKGLSKLFDGAQKQALGSGKKTGEAYRKGLESELKTAEAQVKKISETVAKARDKEADAAGKLRVATEKLNEAREKGIKGSSLTRLETQRESLLRKQSAAAKELAREVDALAQSEKRRSRAQASLDAPMQKKGLFSRIFSGAGDSAESAGGDAANRFSSGFSKVMKAAGVLAIGGSIASGFRSVVTTGLDFERTMNTLSGVTGSGADVMQRFRDTAKALGNDVALSNTSAADAALAMTELAKAGFDVDAAMAGAKGTLQLAAAAQIDAASAATIQANALQAFGLNADYAGKAADILSNAANASSAEITDVAQALQQGGAVASSFGLSIEDTSAAIALLANNGIKGSDAGTLLKSALLALTDQSNPAQGAIETLGLTLYDAQGNFVGLSQMFGELEAASKRLTPEQYQAATATLFGSDAMRLAAVAAKDGQQGIDGMAAAMQKEGSAAELAAAQNQGLPGVVERIKNAAETLAITIFEKIQGPLSSMGDGLRGFIDRMGEAFANPAVGKAAESLGGAIGGIATAVGTVAAAVGPAILGGLAQAVNLIVRFKDFLIPLVAGLVAYKTTMLVITTVTKAWAAIQAVLNIALTANPIGLVIAAIAALVAGIVLAYKNSETFRNVVQTVWTAIKTAIGAVWGWLSKTVFPALVAAFKGLGAAGKWLWNNAIKPAWDGIRNGLQAVWSVVKTVFAAWKSQWQLVGQGAMWLWNNAIKPAWSGITSAFQAAWDFASGIFDKFTAGWDALKTGVTAAASAIKSGVSSAFSGLAGIIKAPLKALGSFLAGIPTSVLGIDIPGADKVQSWGKSLQGLRSGGVVRGPGTGTSDSVLAWLSNGEGVVTAKAMSNGGAGLVQALNQGWVPSAAYLRDMLNAPGYANGLGPGASYLKSLVMKMWPAITTVGGVRSEDGYGEHSSGNALDIMIPNYQSPAGQAMGEQIAAFLRKNSSALQLDGFIWRQQSFGYGGSLTTGKDMPDGGGDTANHMDHVHVMLGKGRGASAAAVSMPTGSLSLPGGLSGGYVGGSSGRGGMSSAQRDRKVADKQTRIDQLNQELAAAEQALAEAEANDKTKESTLMSKRNAVQKKKDAIAKAERELEEIENTPLGDDTASGSSRSSGSDPFSKILDGFGELAQLGADGAMESLLPPGFENPFDWPMLKSAGGLLNFVGSLMPDPISRGIFGALGSGVTGDASGAVSALGGIFMPQDQSGDLTSYGDMGGAYTEGSFGPETALTGGGVDNSIHVGENATMDMSGAQQAVQKSQYQQQRKTFATARK